MKIFRRIKKFSKYILNGNLKKLYQDVLEYRSDKLSIKANQSCLALLESYKEIFANGISVQKDLVFLESYIADCISISDKASVTICRSSSFLPIKTENKIVYIDNNYSKIPDGLFYWANSIGLVKYLHKSGIHLHKIFYIDQECLDYSVSRFFLSVGVISFAKFLEINKNHNPFIRGEFICLGLDEYYIRQNKFIQSNRVVIDKLTINHFNGLRHTLGWIGCGLSYKYLFYKAKQFSLAQISICEDDALFSGEFIKIYADMLDIGKQNVNWDSISGFMVEVPDDVIVNSRVVYNNANYLNIRYFVSTVFNVYNSQLYDKILGWDELNLDKSQNTIDRFISTQIENVIVPCKYPVLLNDTASTLWSGIDKVYKLKAQTAQIVLEAKYNELSDIC